MTAQDERTDTLRNESGSAEILADEALALRVPEQRSTSYPPGAYGKTCTLFSHLRGRFTLTILKLGHYGFLRDVRPLTTHLEHEVFPLLREERVDWLDLEMQAESGAVLRATGVPAPVIL